VPLFHMQRESKSPPTLDNKREIHSHAIELQKNRTHKLGLHVIRPSCGHLHNSGASLVRCFTRRAKALQTWTLQDTKESTGIEKMSDTRKGQKKLKKENIQKMKLENERNEVSKDTKHKQTGSKPRNFSLLQTHETFSVFTPEKKPKQKLKKQGKNSPLIRATEKKKKKKKKKTPQAGKTNQKLYLNQNPFDVNSTDPDALRKKILTTRRERRRHKPLLHESGRMDCSREGDQKRK